MKYYLSSLRLHFKSLLEYKASFILSFISQFFVFFTYYFIILSLFNKFSNIKGFTLYEVLLTFSIIQLGFSIIETFARGIDQFDHLIIDGSYDRLLIRPLPILIQVLSSKIDFVKIARIIQAIIILIISLSNLDITWSFLKIITLFLMIFSSVLVFFGLFLLTAAYCFVTIQGLEVRNLVTDGGKHMAQYPIGVFNKGFVFVFTFIIPYAFVNYYPLLYLLGKTDNVLYGFSPLLVVIFLIPCLLIFKRGQKKYTSVGS